VLVIYNNRGCPVAFFKTEVSSDWKMSDDDNDYVVFTQRIQQSILRKELY
jgi:hypothetical protein